MYDVALSEHDEVVKIHVGRICGCLSSNEIAKMSGCPYTGKIFCWAEYFSRTARTRQLRCQIFRERPGS